MLYREALETGCAEKSWRFVLENTVGFFVVINAVVSKVQVLLELGSVSKICLRSCEGAPSKTHACEFNCFLTIWIMLAKTPCCYYFHFIVTRLLVPPQLYSYGVQPSQTMTGGVGRGATSPKSVLTSGFR